MFLTTIEEEGFDYLNNYFEHPAPPFSYISGFYSSNKPKCLFHNGATYLTAYDETEFRNPILMRWKDGVSVSVQVGTQSITDPLDHQHPTIFIKDDFIYIVQTNGHGDEMKIFKSRTTDILDGFDLHHTIAGNFGYVNPVVLPDDRVVIISRVTSIPAFRFGQLVLVSDPNDFTTWEEIVMTDPAYVSTEYRHYPHSITKYEDDGVWHYQGLNLRTDENNLFAYFAQCILKTPKDGDFKTWYNVDESFSKNVELDGKITNTELENNYTVVGWESDTTYCNNAYTISIRDTLYGQYFNNFEGKWKFFKINPKGVKTEVDVPLDIFNNLPTTNAFGVPIRTWYNGKNLIITNINTGGGFLYTCDLDYSNFEKVFQYYTYDNVKNASRMILPENFLDVNDRYIAGGSGGTEGTENGEIPYFVLEEKFFN